MIGRQPGLLGCSPSRNRMLGSGVGGVDQGNRRHRDSELWVAGINLITFAHFSTSAVMKV